MTIAVIDSRVYNVQIRHSAKDAPFGGSENLKVILIFFIWSRDASALDVTWNWHPSLCIGFVYIK